MVYLETSGLIVTHTTASLLPLASDNPWKMHPRRTSGTNKIPRIYTRACHSMTRRYRSYNYWLIIGSTTSLFVCHRTQNNRTDTSCTTAHNNSEQGASARASFPVWVRYCILVRTSGFQSSTEMSISIEGFRRNVFHEVTDLEGISSECRRVMGKLASTISAPDDEVHRGLKGMIKTHGDWK